MKRKQMIACEFSISHFGQTKQNKTNSPRNQQQLQITLQHVTGGRPLPYQEVFGHYRQSVFSHFPLFPSFSWRYSVLWLFLLVLNRRLIDGQFIITVHLSHYHCHIRRSRDRNRVAVSSAFSWPIHRPIDNSLITCMNILKEDIHYLIYV